MAEKDVTRVTYSGSEQEYKKLLVKPPLWDTPSNVSKHNVVIVKCADRHEGIREGIERIGAFPV